MTREDAINTLKSLKEYYNDEDEDHNYIGFDKLDNMAIDTAIKALEQQPILDMIRAEIEKLQKMCDTNDLNLLSQHSAFGMALDIIDKYRKGGAKLSGGGE